MKEKEIKNIAEKIAYAQIVIDNSTDDDEVLMAEREIVYWANKITSMEDMVKIDDLVQKILAKILTK